MMRGMMLQRRMSRLLVLGLLLLSPAIAMADDAIPVDGRLQGYKENMGPAVPGSTTLTWLTLVGLGVLGVGVMFMSAKRTHLD
jgi:hypothetical protein